MPRISLHILSGALLLASTAAVDPPHPANLAKSAPSFTLARVKSQLAEAYGNLPLSFEVNHGQSDPEVKFIGRGSGYAVFLTPQEAVLSLSASPPEFPRLLRGTKLSKRTGPLVFRMHLMNARTGSELSGSDALQGTTNHFIGNEPSKWRTGIPSYERVVEREIYPGIDLIYHGRQRQLEYDFLVNPGADPNAISLDFPGIRSLELDAEGALVVQLNHDHLRLLKPVAYQQSGSFKHFVPAQYVVRSNQTVGFVLGSYDHSRAVTIDPVLAYSTYLGGTSSDFAVGIAVDSAGNAYVSGYTASTDFPTKSAVQLTNHSPSTCNGPPCSNTNAFVTKLNASGTALVYSTYLGGSTSDVAFRLAVESTGSAYVTGFAQSPDFPTTAGSFEPAFTGLFAEAFVTKLTPTGGLAYSTFVGGPGSDDAAFDIKVDSKGSAYIVGFTRSSKFPTTAGAIQTSLKGPTDGFVTKLNPAGSALVYSTYLGGANSDAAAGLALDSNGDAYVVGGTLSPDFPTTVGAFQRVFAGGSTCFGVTNFSCGDAFVAKINPTGTGLVYSTLLGGSAQEFAFDVAVDKNLNAYVTGLTGSANFPHTATAFQKVFGGPAAGWDAFVTKVNPSGSALVYSTYLGGSGTDVGLGIALDGLGDAYVTGTTGSTNLPVRIPLRSTLNGPTDLFVTELNSLGSGVLFSTYLGGINNEVGASIALDSKANAYVAGLTQSKNFPVTVPTFKSTCSFSATTLCSDALVLKIRPTPVVVFSPSSLNFGSQTVGTVSVTKIVKLSNIGNASLTISKITVSGDFGLVAASTTCGGSLAVGASCNYGLEFKPSVKGTRNGALSVTDNASPQNVSLTGTGT